MEPEDIIEEAAEDESVAVEDQTKEGISSDPKAGSIVSFVESKFERAKNARRSDEQRWLQAYRNYRGIYGPDVQFTETEKSRVFVKVTKTKVIAAYGQVAGVLFGGDRFPLGVDPTTLPEGVEESVHWEVQEGAAPEGSQEEMPELQPGDTMQSIQDRLGAMKEKLEPVGAKLKTGPGGTPTSVTVHPAQYSAKKMEKQIHDQLEESNASKHLRKAAFEQVLFGTGIMKGPFAVTKEYPKWDEDGEYKPVFKTIPSVSYTSIWNFYPDPDADTMDDSEFSVERHKLSRSQLRALKKRPQFRKTAIDSALAHGEGYIEEWWEDSLEESNPEARPERFEALEFWGYVDTDVLEEHDIDLGELKDAEQVQVNIWICNGQLLRLVMNPFTPSYIPYYAMPYEVNPYSFFGIGIAENMEDTQTLMNGFMRMAVDNAALSGNLIIEVDETNLVPGQDMTVYPGKVFRRQGGAPGQAIFGTNYPNVSNENMQMFDKARQLSDESTGLPSFSHGQTGVSGVGRTSSGISMLMSAANGSIRTVVKNIDDYLLSPLGKAMFRFNMQFNYDKDIVGDLEVKARGTESLMANEVRSQRLMQFLQVVSNPLLAPFAKMDFIVREIAKSMDLDPDKVTNSLADAAIQAEIMKGLQQTMAPPEQAGGPPPVGDPTGGGGSNIGVGQAAVPGEQGFSGNVPQ